MTEVEPPDIVNSPPHYSLNPHGVECIEAIRAESTDEQFLGYCRGNVTKYLWRMDNKGKREEDVNKALWYLLRVKETIEGKPLKSLTIQDHNA